MCEGSMIITTQYIRKLNPCEDRLDNWNLNYKDFNGSLLEFLDLDKITHEDKVWVYFRSINPELIPTIAADMAELVLHIFEKEYPNDLKPRKAIEAARNKDKDAANAAAYAA